MFHIEVDNICIQVQRKKIKSLRLSISPPSGEVRVSIPHQLPDKLLHKFLREKIEWIKKHKLKFENQGQKRPLYLSGERQVYQGKVYELRLCEEPSRSRPFIRLGEDQLIFKLPLGASFLQKQKWLNHWYKKQLTQELERLLPKWEQIFKQTVKEFRIRQMKTRWGTCNPLKARICFNLELIKKSRECLEYIIVHEMVHFFERYHNARFYQLMDLYLPSWRLFKKELNQPINQ